MTTLNAMDELLAQAVKNMQAVEDAAFMKLIEELTPLEFTYEVRTDKSLTEYLTTPNTCITTFFTSACP